MVGRVIEGTIVLIVLYLILSNSKGFSDIVKSSGAVYGNSVKVLQGRG